MGLISRKGDGACRSERCESRTHARGRLHTGTRECHRVQRCTGNVVNPRAEVSCKTLTTPVRRKPPRRQPKREGGTSPSRRAPSTPPKGQVCRGLVSCRRRTLQELAMAGPKAVSRKGGTGSGRTGNLDAVRAAERPAEGTRKAHVRHVGEGNLTGVSVLPTRRGVEQGQP